MNSFLTPIIVAELICLTMSVVCLYRDTTRWRYMIALMFITCVVEISGHEMARNGKDNTFIYNLYFFPNLLLTSVMYAWFIRPYRPKSLIVPIGTMIALATYAFELSMHDFTQSFNIAFSVSSVLFITYGQYYFFQLLSSNNYVNLARFPPFWWLSGIFLFCFGTVLSDLLFLIVKNSMTPEIKVYRMITFAVFNFILYGFWSYSFLCRYQQRNSTV